MSNADIPVDTDVERILKSNAETHERLQALTDAVNTVGKQQQWMIDQAQGIFQMFSNPAFMGQLPGVLSGGVPDGG